MGTEQGHWRRDIEERLRKQHEVMFEACKHFTMLNTAATLIVVAIFRETDTGLSAVLWQLFFFGLSLALCSYGMLATALGGLGNDKVAISTGGALLVGFVVFVAGLIQTVLAILY